MGDGPNDAGLSRHHILSGAEASLRRLGTDHIDIYHVHEWDGQTPVEETLSTLDALVQSGKVRYLAASNYCGLAAHEGAGRRGRAAATSGSSPSRSTTPSRRGTPSTSWCRWPLDQGLGILVWSPLAGGLLSGKFRRDARPSRRTRAISASGTSRRCATRTGCTTRSRSSWTWPRPTGCRPPRSRWPGCSRRPGVTSLVIGARTDEQLADNLAAADLVLSSDERAALDQVSAPDLIYPHWHQAQTASDRLSDPDLALLAPHLKK